MTKPPVTFDELPGYDELSDEERELQARRIATYSKDAIRAGQQVDSIYMFHPPFKAALDGCDRIFHISREFTMPQGMRLFGPPGSGKSSVFKYFSKSLPKSTLFAPGWGCIGIRVYERTTVGHIVAGLLRAYQYPFTKTSEQMIYLKRNLVFELIRQKGTRLIFIDSAHHLLHRGHPQALMPTGNDFLVELMDETQVGIVLAGSEALARDELMSKELLNRISVRCELSDFGPNAQWEGIVKALVKTCSSADLSFLLTQGQPKTLHVATAGNLRALKRLVTEAVMVCVHEQQTEVNREHLRVAFERVFGRPINRMNPYLDGTNASSTPAAVAAPAVSR